MPTPLPVPPAPSTPSVTISAAVSTSLSLGEQFAAYESIQSPFISTPNSTFSAGASFGQIHYGGRHLGQISSHNGMPMLSEDGQKWISARTGEDVSFSRFHRSFHQRTLPPTLSPQHFYSSTSELYELPDRSVVEKVMDAFLRSAFRLVFPVIDRYLFEETIDLAYQECDGPPSLDRISAKGCIFAFISIMCLFQGKVDNMPPIDGDACAVKAHYLLSDVFEDASIVSLQTVFMLVSGATFRMRFRMRRIGILSNMIISDSTCIRPFPGDCNLHPCCTQSLVASSLCLEDTLTNRPSRPARKPLGA